MSDTENPQPRPSLKQLAATLLAADAESQRLTGMMAVLDADRKKAQQTRTETERLLIAHLEDREPGPEGSIYCKANKTQRLLVTIVLGDERRTLALRTEAGYGNVFIDTLDAAVEIRPTDALPL